MGRAVCHGGVPQRAADDLRGGRPLPGCPESGKRPAANRLAQQPGPARQLAGRYPYLKEKPYLLPLAWVNRILKYGKETAGGSADNNAAQSIKIGNGRVALLKEYGIIGSGRE